MTIFSWKGEFRAPICMTHSRKQITGTNLSSDRTASAWADLHLCCLLRIAPSDREKFSSFEPNLGFPYTYSIKLFPQLKIG